jgi:transcription-repair coupling factor (superfamily II helicase)
MKIYGLLDCLGESKQYLRLRKELAATGSRARIIEAAKPYLLAGLFRDLKRPMLVISVTPERSRILTEQLTAWLGKTSAVQLPEPDGLPYTRSSQDALTALDKLRILSSQVTAGKESPPLLVASVPALLQKVPSAEQFKRGWIEIKNGLKIDPMALASRLDDLGYRNESMVEVPGSYSRRGDIIDLFPPTLDMPVRMELFGNEVERIRMFDPLSQRSLKPVDELKIGPAAEMSPHFLGNATDIKSKLNDLRLNEIQGEALAEFDRDIALFENGQYPVEATYYAPLFNFDSIVSYLQPGTLVVLDAPGRIRSEAAFLDEESSKTLEERLAAHEVPPNFPPSYINWTEFESRLSETTRLELLDFEDTEPQEAIQLEFKSAVNYAGRIDSWIARTSELSAANQRIVAVSHQAGRLSELMAEANLDVDVVDQIKAAPLPGSTNLVQGLLAEGWEFGGKLFLFSDKELFGFVKQQRLTRRRPIAHHKLFTDVKPGDYVVHIEHGVGKFSGVTTMEAGGIKREYMLLEYAAGDRLYVPADQIDRLERYVGAGDREPTLNTLGSLEWVHSKDRAKRAAEEVAQELLEIYAAREVVSGFAYSGDNNWQIELETSFPYVETPDQLTAIAQIKDDMSHTRPMDRLVCGDVGYGKTEVALRAAFKAVQDDKQVAVLVPTTVLAQQHYATFKERLSAFPVRVESLSRFRSHKEQEEVVSGIADGSVDIAIGTHRLLQKDVTFKDLGLLIIDEEQRFGVGHKEHFKRLRKEVDVLTLSATPIPRTLNLSLAGVRDMSVMETPPEERLPIKTFVAEFNEQLVREAIVRELERNGQVFFVHNRVQSIGILAEKLKKLVPEARFAVGHGQMHEDALEKVMTDFAQGNVDVLLCTTIIESGLDVPNANTLIINQADKMGLTQLYQLRGRVGRGAVLAYAYFFYDKGKRLTADADQRLRTIYEATELGAGFGIAMKDLEIRGAGNILGVRQSGHINSVGFSLYTQLLAEAVEDLKAKKSAEKAGKSFVPALHLPPPTIDLPQQAYIPEDYVADTDTRLSLYKCLAGARNTDGVESLGKDFLDRFGDLPDAVQNLLFAVRIKVLATVARLESVSTEGSQIVLRRPLGMQFDVARIGAVRMGIKVSLNQIRLDTVTLDANWKQELEAIIKRLAI